MTTFATLLALCGTASAVEKTTVPLSVTCGTPAEMTAMLASPPASTQRISMPGAQGITVEIWTDAEGWRLILRSEAKDCELMKSPWPGGPATPEKPS